MTALTLELLDDYNSSLRGMHMRRLCTALGLLALVSCGASPPVDPSSPPPRHPSFSIAEGFILIDASFATEIHDRQPARVSTLLSVPATENDLSFWMELACTGFCEQRLAAEGELIVFLDWYKEESGLLLKQASMPLNVKGAHWRTWGTKRVGVGNWVAVVRADDSWVCLREQCYFSIAVQQ